MSERRYTDREVARILDRATELDRDRPDRPGTRGLSLDELKEIGDQAGIPEHLIARAAAEVGERRGGLALGSLMGAPLVRRESRAVGEELDRAALGALVERVEARVPAQGTVTEALGSVRWTARGRFLGRQVALEPREGETGIRVEERYTPRLRAVVQGVPAAYAGLLGAVLGSELVGPLAGVVGAVALTLAVWLVARVVWSGISARSARRVHALVEELAEAATGMAREAPPHPELPSGERGSGSRNP